MATNEERLVPKVHPASRAVEPDDPYSLHATAVAGDPQVMLACFVQEYAWMGWDLEGILGLIGNSSYPALNGLLDAYGPVELRRRVGEILATVGVFRYSGVVQEAPAEADDEPELLQLGLPRDWRSPLSIDGAARRTADESTSQERSGHGQSL
jgi:hypothetical protein